MPNVPVEEEIDAECSRQSCPVDQHCLPRSWDIVLMEKIDSSEDELRSAKVDRRSDAEVSFGYFLLTSSYRLCPATR